jgi:hypothetical protein|tara:strand:+ start:240 stop:593 length:354 start_codon:yes stop_codon:yes gene_type:complete
VTTEEEDGHAKCRELLLQADRRIVELEGKTKTTITGTQLLVLVMVGPLFAAFVALGILIVWKTTSNPDVVAPHLDIILLAFAIFANPVTAASGVLVALMGDEIKSKITASSSEASSE